jgi:two-component sensor histidine kinase
MLPLEVLQNLFQGLLSAKSAFVLSALPLFLITFPWKKAKKHSTDPALLKNAIRDPFILLDSENKLLEFNPAFKKVFGQHVSLAPGLPLQSVLPELENLLQQTIRLGPDSEQNLLFTYQGVSYELQLHTPEFQGARFSHRLLVLHNVTPCDQLEHMLQTKNQELVKRNNLFTSLASLTLILQTASDPNLIIETLGDELHQLGLKCFVAIKEAETQELVVQYFSEKLDTIRIIEKIINRSVLGFHLERAHFSSLYHTLEEKRLIFLSDEESGLKVFLGNLPGWILDPLIKASAVSRHEASMLVPLIADEKVVGLMGVWGQGLQESDIAPFQLFGGQVGWAIEKSILLQTETSRLEELTHANLMISALSKVSSILETTTKNEVAYNILDDELSKIGLSCAVVTLDSQKELATIQHVSFNSASLQKVEQIIGIKFVGYQIPKRFWPGLKATHEGMPVWYENAENVFKTLFPHLPESVSQAAFKLLKGRQTGRLCFLPLRIQGEVVGVMPIWGHTIHPKDSLTLSLFGDQVAAIMTRNNIYESELQKSQELAHLNSMILGLSGVAAQLDSTTDLNQVFQTLGNELKKINLNCMVGTLDQPKQFMKIEYLSLAMDLMTLAKKLGFPWLDNMLIPRRLWPTDKAVTDKAPYWDPKPIGNAYKMFPNIPKDVFNNAMRLVNWDLNEAVCYLPMIIEEDVIGILAVWGRGLQKEDLPALSLFANQVATAIKNTRLYTQAQNEITERTQAEAVIRETLAEKEVLLKEVHHRVKNNLQIISSLLNLQAAEVSDPNILNALRESQNRVRTMALIHEKLYQSNDLAKIDFSTYLHSLVSFLAQTYQVRTDCIEIQVETEKILLDLDTAIPCGLIVNELVSNSLKYAFPNGQPGKIRVSCSHYNDRQYSLVVWDNGVGLPPDFNISQSTSLGLKLVNSLINQIDGSLNLERTKGARYEILFSKPEMG